MNPTAQALTGFIAWFLLLLVTLGIYRTFVVMTQKKAPNSFKPDGSDVSDFAGRLCRAHANCYESFPFVGGVLLLALATQSTDITNGLALVMLGARVVQSLVHLISTSVMAVQLRFACFLVQVGIAVSWLPAFWQKFA